ncbi:PAS domain-containing protein [Paenibacillus sp. Marseille-Q4541]|uniref:PAS domain-containing protein n=1 Tax=Paenibacillus sp. Marseille-Q4541 TaxID=2831522 RepID=UPI001BA60BF2|nr:PAS domain-containing protein [Paenibacillus sp. Marseille-Q4541]
MPEANPLRLEDSYHQFRSGTVMIDEEGTIRSYNHNWLEKMTGLLPYPAESYLGMNYYTMLREIPGTCIHNTQLIVHNLQKVLLQQTTGYVCEVGSITDDGYSWLRLEASLYETSLQPDFKGLVISHFDITSFKLMETHLSDASSQIKTLRGMLPICAVCKRIRDEEDEWNSVESFIEKNTHAEFTHDICPDCIRRLYPKYSGFLDEP